MKAVSGVVAVAAVVSGEVVVVVVEEVVGETPEVEGKLW